MTRPTKAQEQACDRLAEALLAVTEAVRLDGRAAFDRSDLRETAARLARASSAFGLDAILARTLERRGRSLGLRAGTAELLTLIEGDTPPLETLLLPDADFLAHVAAMEQELGEV